MDSSLDNYPHHWDCQYTSGHPDGGNQCIISDGSTRTPDGSIARRAEIQRGGVYMASHDIGGGNVTIHEIKAPKG